MKSEIEELIKVKEDSIESLGDFEREREEILANVVKKQSILRSLEVADRANLWTDEGRKLIKKEHAFLSQLLRVEQNIRIWLNGLNQAEYSFHTKINTGEIILLPQLKYQLLELISKQDGHDIRTIGILQIIAQFLNSHKNEINYEAELGKLLTEDMIQELINGKFKIIGRDWNELLIYNTDEKTMLQMLRSKISSQIRILSVIKTSPAQKPTSAGQPTPVQQPTPKQTSQSSSSREQILLQEIIQNGATFLHTCVPNQYNPKKSGGGYCDIVSPKRMDYNPREPFGMRIKNGFKISTNDYRDPSDVLMKKGINEAVYLKLLVEDVEKEVPETVRGRFGFGSKTVMRRQKIGQKSVYQNQLVRGGSNEEACSLVYLTTDNDFPDQAYHVYDGRFSNIILIQTVLPKSLGEKAFDYIKQNPKFARLFAQEIILKEFGIPLKAWNNGDEYTRNHPLRPPYEIWAQKPGGCKIYIQEDTTEYGFNPSFVHAIR